MFMELKMLDFGLKKMLKSLKYSPDDFKKILQSIYYPDDIYAYKAKASSEDGVLWDVSYSGKKCFQFLGVGKLKINYSRSDYGVIVNGYTVYEVFIDDYGYFCSWGADILHIRENACIGQNGMIEYSYDQGNPTMITYEDGKKKIIIKCVGVNNFFSYFMKSFLEIYNSDDVTVIDVARCLPLDSGVYYEDNCSADISIINKLNGKSDNLKISDYKKNLLINDEREIKISRISDSMGCCQMTKFACKCDDYELIVRLEKGSDVDIDENNALENSFDFNNPIVYDILEYLNNLKLPADIEEVYIRFLSFSNELKEFPFLMISVFNKDLGFTIEMHNGECILLRSETDEYVSEWYKDGNFKYEKREELEKGFIVTIDSDLKACYNGPVEFDSIDSRVIDPNEMLSYKAVVEAKTELYKMKEWSERPFTRMRIK